MNNSIDKYLKELNSQIKTLRDLDALNQKQYQGGAGAHAALTKTQLHLLTEALFFAAFRSYEQFIRNTFLLYCCGVQSGGRKLVRSHLQPRTIEHAEDLIKSSMPFLDWSSPDNLIDRAETYLKEGYPIKNAIASNLEPLRDLKRIRNHIAHMSKESLAEYKKTIRQHFATTPLKIPRPGEYLLLTPRSVPTNYYLSVYFSLIEKVAATMAK